MHNECVCCHGAGRQTWRRRYALRCFHSAILGTTGLPVCYLPASEGVEFRKGRPGGSGWFWVVLRGLAWGLPHALISWSHSHLRAPSKCLWLTGCFQNVYERGAQAQGLGATASLGAALEPRPLEPRPDAKKEVPDNGPQEAGPLRARFFSQDKGGFLCRK